MFSQKNTAGNVQTQSQESLDRVNRSRDEASTCQGGASCGYNDQGGMNGCDQNQGQFAQNNYNSAPNNYQAGPNNYQGPNGNQVSAPSQQQSFNQNQNFNRGDTSFSQPQGSRGYLRANSFNQGHNQNFSNQNQGCNGPQCMNSNGSNATLNNQQRSFMQQPQGFNGQHFNNFSNFNGSEQCNIGCNNQNFNGNQGFNRGQNFNGSQNSDQEGVNQDCGPQNCDQNDFNQGSGPDNFEQNSDLNDIKQMYAFVNEVAGFIQDMVRREPDSDYDPDNPVYNSRLDKKFWDFCLADDFPRSLVPANNPFFDPFFDEWLSRSFSITSNEEPKEEWDDLKRFEDALLDLDQCRENVYHTSQLQGGQTQRQNFGNNQAQMQQQNFGNNQSQMQQQSLGAMGSESAQNTYAKLKQLEMRYGVEDTAPAPIPAQSAPKAEVSPRPEIKDPIHTLDLLDQFYGAKEEAEAKAVYAQSESAHKAEVLSRPNDTRAQEQIQTPFPEQMEIVAQVNAKLDALANPQAREVARHQGQSPFPEQMGIVAQVNAKLDALANPQVRELAQPQEQFQEQVLSQELAQENSTLVDVTSTESVYNALVPAERMVIKPDNVWGLVMTLEVFGMPYSCAIARNDAGLYCIDFSMLRELEIGRGLSIGSQKPSFYEHFYATPRELEFYSALTIKNGFLRRVFRDIAQTLRNYQASADLNEQQGNVAPQEYAGLPVTIGYKETVPLCKVDLHMRSIGGGKLGYSLDSLLEIFQFNASQALACLDLLHDHVGLDNLFYCPNDGDGFPALYVPSEVVQRMVAKFSPFEANAILRKISDLDSGVYYKHQQADIAYANEVAKDKTSLFTGLYATDPANYVYNNVEKKILKSLLADGCDLSAFGVELEQLPFTIVTALIALYLFRHRDVSRKLDSVHQEFYIRRFACGFIYEPTADVVKLVKSFKTAAQLEVSKKRSAKRAAAKASKLAKEAAAKQEQAQVVTEVVAAPQEQVAPSVSQTSVQVTEAQATIAQNSQEEAQAVAQTESAEVQVNVVDDGGKTTSPMSQTDSTGGITVNHQDLALTLQNVEQSATDVDGIKATLPTSTIASIEVNNAYHQDTALTSQELMHTATNEVQSNVESQLTQQAQFFVRGSGAFAKVYLKRGAQSATSVGASDIPYDPFEYRDEDSVPTPPPQVQEVSSVSQDTAQTAVPQTTVAVQGSANTSQELASIVNQSATSFAAPVKPYDPFEYRGEESVTTPPPQTQNVSPVSQESAQSAVATTHPAQNQQENTQATPQATPNAPVSKPRAKLAKVVVEDPDFYMDEVRYTENIDNINSQIDLSYQFHAKQLDDDSDFVCVFIPEVNGFGPVNLRYPIYEDSLRNNHAEQPIPSFSHVELQKLMMECAPYCEDMAELFSDITCQAKIDGVKDFLLHNCRQKDLNDDTLNATGEKPLSFHEAMDSCILVPEMPPYRVKMDEHLFVYIERRFEQTSLEAYVDDLSKRLAFLGKAFVRDLGLLYRLAYNEGLDWAGKNFGLQTLLRLQKVTPDYAKRLISEFDRCVNDIASPEHSRQVLIHKNYWSEIPEQFLFKAKKALEVDLESFGLENVAVPEGQNISSEQDAVFAKPAELLTCKPWNQFFGFGQEALAAQADQITVLSQQLTRLKDHVEYLSKVMDGMTKEHDDLSRMYDATYEEAEGYWRSLGDAEKKLEESKKELESSKTELNSTKELLLASQEQAKQALALVQDKDAQLDKVLASCQEYQEREKGFKEQLQAQSELLAKLQAKNSFQVQAGQTAQNIQAQATQPQAQIARQAFAQASFGSSPNAGFAEQVRPEQAQSLSQTAQTVQVQASQPQAQTARQAFAQASFRLSPNAGFAEQVRPEQAQPQSHSHSLSQSLSQTAQTAQNAQDQVAFNNLFQEEKPAQTVQTVEQPQDGNKSILMSVLDSGVGKSSSEAEPAGQVRPEQAQPQSQLQAGQNISQSQVGQNLSQPMVGRVTQNVAPSNNMAQPKAGGQANGQNISQSQTGQVGQAGGFKIPAPKYAGVSQVLFEPKLKSTIDPRRAKSITQLEQELPKSAVSFNGVEVHQFDLTGVFFSVPDIAPEFVLIPRAGVNTKKRKYGEALWLNATDRVSHEQVHIHQPSAIFCSQRSEDGYAQVPTVFTTLNNDTSKLYSVEGRVVMQYKPRVNDGFNCDNLAGFTRVSLRPRTTGIELTRVGRSKPVNPVGIACSCQCSYSDVPMGFTVLGARTPYHSNDNGKDNKNSVYAATVKATAHDAERLIHNRPLSDIRTYSDYFDFLPEELDFNQIQCDHLRYDFYRPVKDRYHGVDIHVLTPDQYITLLVDKMPFAHQLDLVLQEIAMLAFKEGLIMNLESRAQESMRSTLNVVEQFICSNLISYQKHFKTCISKKESKPFEFNRSELRPDIESTTWRDGYQGEWGYSFLNEAFVQKYYQTTSTHYVVCDMDCNCLLVPSPAEHQSLEDYLSSIVPLLRFGEAFWSDVRTMTLLAREDAARWVGDHPDITLDKVLNSFANFVGAAFRMRLNYFNHHLFDECYSWEKANEVKSNQADDEMFDIVRCYLEEDMSLDSRGIMNSNNLQTVVSLFVQGVKQSDLAAQFEGSTPVPDQYVPLNSPVANIDNITTAYGKSRQLVKNAMFEVSRLAIAEGVFDMFNKSQVFFLLVALKRLTASIFSKLDVYTDRACGYRIHSDNLIHSLQCLPNWFEKDYVAGTHSQYSAEVGVQKIYDQQQEFPLYSGISVTVPPVRPGSSASDFIASFVNKPYQYQVDNWTYVKLHELARASYYNGLEWTRYNSTSFVDTAIESFNNHFLPQMQGYLEFFIDKARKHSLPKGRPRNPLN